ncbi:MAG: tRNA guanosine(34) transglycosylase Tgt [Patescibacteria group bacterium]|nr:tRNA guanosine(34) transglycosylase Tgt [Patescibacteria group bacterium]MDW8279939.1 tRNA guanosine(34) transglycosylase Tgt [bacterium]
MFNFQIIKKSKKSLARIGKIKTPHGEIITPAFLPVATLGVIKGGLTFNEFLSTGVQAQITNSFHFLDLDYIDVIFKAGGLHKFFNFSKPIFTDSGGFQIFSLGRGNEFGLGKIASIFPEEQKKKSKNQLKSLQKRNNLIKKISEEGVWFLSPRNGRLIDLTPEKAFDVQNKLGADFIYVLDVCGTPLDDYFLTQKELEISHQWFNRFIAQYKKIKNIENKQQIFGIIQGGLFDDLRLKSAEFVNNLDVFGIAIGGALGKNKKDMFKILKVINKKIDFNRPHHLLGIGSLSDLENLIKQGIDLFDCVLPTRMARHGMALIKRGFIDIVRKKYQKKFEPIDKDCDCFTCKNYNLAQIYFLFKAKELLAGHLLTIHNLYFFEKVLQNIRNKILSNKI